ncbi:preprotein translocase subunit SecE [Patescibacteria group bacterium]
MNFFEDNKLSRFLKEAYRELKKVVWPTKKQAIRLTLIVTAVVIATAIFLGGFDLLFSELVRILVIKS